MSALGIVANNVNKIAARVDEFATKRLWGSAKTLLSFPAKVLYKALVVAPFMALVGLAGVYLPAALRGVSAFVAPVASRVAPYIPAFVSNAFAAAGSFFAAVASKIGSFIPASVSARFAALGARVAPYAPETVVGLLAGKDQRNASRTVINAEPTDDVPNPKQEVEHAMSMSDVALETLGGIGGQAAARYLLPAFAGLAGPAGFVFSTVAFGAGAALVNTVKNDAPRAVARFRAGSE